MVFDSFSLFAGLGIQNAGCGFENAARKFEKAGCGI